MFCCALSQPITHGVVELRIVSVAMGLVVPAVLYWPEGLLD